MVVKLNDCNDRQTTPRFISTCKFCKKNQVYQTPSTKLLDLRHRIEYACTSATPSMLRKVYAELLSRTQRVSWAIANFSNILNINFLLLWDSLSFFGGEGCCLMLSNLIDVSTYLCNKLLVFFHTSSYFLDMFIRNRIHQFRTISGYWREIHLIRVLN